MGSAFSRTQRWRCCTSSKNDIKTIPRLRINVIDRGDATTYQSPQETLHNVGLHRNREANVLELQIPKEYLIEFLHKHPLDSKIDSHAVKKKIEDMMQDNALQDIDFGDGITSALLDSLINDKEVIASAINVAAMSALHILNNLTVETVLFNNKIRFQTQVLGSHHDSCPRGE